MAKVGDEFILHSQNGMDYKIEVINVNDFREPSMKYACDVVADNGASFYNDTGDFYFCGDEMLNKCEPIRRE